MEKTAVEFIFDAVYRDITFSELLGIITQAKVMEKQQDKNKYSEEEVEFIRTCIVFYWSNHNDEHLDNLKAFEISKSILEKIKK
jgi:hypothetical protein